MEFGRCDLWLFGEWNLKSITQWLQESFTLIVELWSFICHNLHSKSSKFGYSPKMPIAHLQYLGVSQRCFVSSHPITFHQNWFQKASNGSTQTKHPQRSNKLKPTFHVPCRKAGPYQLYVISRVVTRLIGVMTPLTHLFVRPIKRGYTSILGATPSALWDEQALLCAASQALEEQQRKGGDDEGIAWFFLWGAGIPLGNWFPSDSDYASCKMLQMGLSNCWQYKIHF